MNGILHKRIDIKMQGVSQGELLMDPYCYIIPSKRTESGVLFHNRRGLAVERVGPHGQGKKVRVVNLQIFHIVYSFLNQ